MNLTLVGLTIKRPTGYRRDEDAGPADGKRRPGISVQGAVPSDGLRRRQSLRDCF